MSFDGIITRAMVNELRAVILNGRIAKINQPTKQDIVLSIYTKSGMKKLYASSSGSDARLHFIETMPPNPPTPPPFCMLLRKHIGQAKIKDLAQKGVDRIIEMSLESMNELGFALSKKLIFEIMGRHSNIILIDSDSHTIIDSIKRVSIDTSRVRQILPGKQYEYPPDQDKIPFDRISKKEFCEIGRDPKAILKSIGGISPAVSRELAAGPDGYSVLQEAVEKAEHPAGPFRIYMGADKKHLDFHLIPLSEYENDCDHRDFDSLSACLDHFYEERASAGRARIDKDVITKRLSTLLEKAYLKNRRLHDDLLRAEKADYMRLYGELIIANLYRIPSGLSSVTLTNYYNGEEVAIPLDPMYSPSDNAQRYFKKYNKAVRAIKEKTAMISETEEEIDYLESVMTFVHNADGPDDIENIKDELIENGYIKPKKNFGKKRPTKSKPLKYISPSGFEILAGKNNKENDRLTLNTAAKTDLWLHTKDIPGSHIILRLNGHKALPEDIYCAAQVAAYHSKGRNSSKVPVDYVKVKYVKKPNGSKPGKVIFTNNKTVFVDPKLPDRQL